MLGNALLVSKITSFVGVSSVKAFITQKMGSSIKKEDTSAHLPV